MDALWVVLLKLLAVAVLVAANGFFVMVEFSVVSVRRAKIEAMLAQGSASARQVQRMIEQTDRMLAADQLGITMASLALGWIGEVTLVELIRPVFVWLFEGLPLAAGIASHAVATTIAFLLITLLLLVLGEQAPKIYAIRHPERRGSSSGWRGSRGTPSRDGSARWRSCASSSSRCSGAGCSAASRRRCSTASSSSPSATPRTS